MAKTMRKEGFTITERKDGTYKIIKKDPDKTYDDICKDFTSAGEWVWNMADNGDQADRVCERMCDVFGKRFF